MSLGLQAREQQFVTDRTILKISSAKPQSQMDFRQDGKLEVVRIRFFEGISK